jgi:hypothetical protein
MISKKLTAIIAVLLVVSVAAIALSSTPNYTSLCTIKTSTGSMVGTCSALLSVTSGSPGTMVTVTATNFNELAADVGYQFPYNQNGVQYAIYLQQTSGQPNVVLVASGDLTCSYMACAGNSPAVTFMDLGTFTATFAVPHVSPGTYNALVTAANGPILGTDSSNTAYGSALGIDVSESASATFTVT